jgi:GMP synthase-like glutamine amidotransferase
MRFHCLIHVPFETPGLLTGHILERGHSLGTTALFLGEPLPSTAQFDALIIMGGPMSVHDEDAYPWLREEKDLIAAAIREKKKVLGICLGAQLIALVSGARVYPNPEKEIGFWPLRWTEAAGAGTAGTGAAVARPADSLVFHWHGETFDLPAGAVLLASSEACVNQAFALGDHVLGLQFHPEVTPEIIRAMIDHEGEELVDAPYIQPAADMLAQAGDLAAGSGAVAGAGGMAGAISFLTYWL